MMCFVCKMAIPGQIQELRDHFDWIHGLLYRKEPFRLLMCYQNQCTKEFAKFKDLAQHIRTYHLNNNIQSVDTVQQFYEGSSVLEVESVPDLPITTPLDDKFQQFLETAHSISNSLIADSRFTGPLADIVISASEQIMTQSVQYIKSEIEAAFGNDPKCCDLVSKIDLVSPFQNLNTQWRRLKTFNNEYTVIQPREVVLGHRIEEYYVGTEMRRHKISEHFQYVSILKTLSEVMKTNTIRNVLKSEKLSEDGKIRSFLDGTKYKSFDFFKDNPNALRITLYFDEFEAVNPLGSKVGIHKVGGFYYSIQNFPIWINSKLKNIFLMGLAFADDIKKYGMDQIIKPFIEDLKILESENGFVTCDASGESLVIRATLGVVTGDTAGMHDLFGFMGAGSDFFCRQCLISRENFHISNVKGIERTCRQHAELLTKLKQNPNLKPHYGVKLSSMFNHLRFFNVTENFVWDIMHDLFEGVIPLIVKLVLQKYVRSKEIKTEQLNARIKSFKYGYTEKLNKPSSNFTPAMIYNDQQKIKQRATQQWLLSRVIPFILYDKVTTTDDEMVLLALLNQLVSIIVMEEFSEGSLQYLDCLLINFNFLCEKVFPKQITLNKSHHLLHYTDSIRQIGPLIHYWCMRFEGKHNEFKHIAQTSNNFKNITKTLANRHQTIHAYYLEELFSKTNLNCEIQFSKIDNYIKSVDINGTEYRLGLMVCFDYCEKEFPKFGKIDKIEIQLSLSIVIFTIILYETVAFNEILNAFEIETTTEVSLVSYKDLVHYKPLNIWQTYDSDKKFICPKVYL